MTARWVPALITVTSLAGCKPSGSQELEGCGAVVSWRLDKSPREIVETFTSSNLETQYEIYVCMNQRVHPPALYLAESFAVGGEPAATFLKQKLEQTTSDTTVLDIIRVYAEMQRQGTYDVKGDVELMRLLGDRVQAIRDEYWRKYCAEILGMITGA